GADRHPAPLRDRRPRVEGRHRGIPASPRRRGDEGAARRRPRAPALEARRVSWPGASLFPNGVTLETERLRLRILEERDLDPLATMYADPDTMRYLGEGKVISRADTWRAISGGLGHWLLRGYGMWAVETRE